MDTSLFGLSGKVAVVTGGGRGIGRSIALGLAKAGANVAVASRTLDELKCVCREIEALGTKGLAVVCDVSDPKSILAAVDTVVAKFGGLDIVVNNAGANARVPGPEKITTEQWQTIIATNLTAVHILSTRAHPEFVKRGGGKIINISSMVGIFGGKTIAAYAASKGGVEQYTKSCAIAWAKDNIQVNILQPGWIATKMTTGSRSDPNKFNNIVDRTPAGRYGEPEEFVGPAVFLASKASSFVTGTSLPVDGGYACNVTSKTVDI